MNKKVVSETIAITYEKIGETQKAKEFLLMGSFQTDKKICETTLSQKEGV